MYTKKRYYVLVKRG